MLREADGLRWGPLGVQQKISNDSRHIIMEKQLQAHHHGKAAPGTSSWKSSSRHIIMEKQLQAHHHGKAAPGSPCK
jgi:hypothetical protein